MTVTRIYAEGFLEYAKETIGFERGLKELKDAKYVFRRSPELLVLLENAAVTYQEKCKIIEEVFSANLSLELCRFLQLLLKKGRIRLFPDMAEYARIKYSHDKEIDAVLETTYLLDMAQLEAIKEKAEKVLENKLHLYVKINPSLLGGVRLTAVNKVIDGSVKRRMDDLKRKLNAVGVS